MAEYITDKFEYGGNVYKLKEAIMQSKTFTGLIGSANSFAGAGFFVGKIVPTDYYTQWQIKYRVYIQAAGDNRARASSEVYFMGAESSLTAYYCYNSIQNGSYRPAYYHCLYRATSAGLATYGHIIGVDLTSSWNRTTAANSRTLTVEILDTQNCTFTFFDSALKYENVPGTGSTNYSALSEPNFADNGLQETSDANTIDQNRICYTYQYPKTALYRYQICFTMRDSARHLLPTNAVSNAPSNTAKALTTEAFDPFGEIYYYNSTTTVNADANIANQVLYRQVLADVRYSFNIAGTSASHLTAYQPLYVVATPQADGTAKLASTPLSQTLPTSEDGLIYIYLGQVYPDTYPYKCELRFGHPVYWYKNGAVELYVPPLNVATTNVIGGVKVPASSIISNNSGAIDVKYGTGLDVDNNNNLIVSLSASNIPTITSAKISDFTSAAKTAIGIASSGSTFLRKDGTWASPTVSSIAWSSVTSKPFTSVNESGGLEVASNSLQVKAAKGLAFNDDSGELEVAYTFAGGTNKFTVTPSGGTAQNVTITPSITVTAAVTDGVWDLTGTNGTNKVTYAVAPYTASTATQTWVANSNNAGKFYLGTQYPQKTTRLNYNGYIFVKDVYANGQSVDSRLTALEEQICLIEGTKITMADGSEKNIEDVKVGDMVLSYNPSTGKQIEAMALQSVRTGVAKDFDVFIFDNGNVAEMFQEHSVYDVNLGYPHSHKEWKVGDVGLMADGEQSALARITTARHAIIKQRYVLCVSTGLYYANGILMGIWSSTKYNIVSRPCYNLNLPDKILNEFKRCGEMNDKANLLEINPDYIKQAKPIQQTIHRLSTEIEEAKKNLTDTDYLVAKFTEGLISTAEWLKSKASRANWRTIINNDESPLAEAKEQLENLKARIKGQVPTLKDNYWESVNESNKLLPEFKAWYVEWSKSDEIK